MFSRVFARVPTEICCELFVSLFFCGGGGGWGSFDSGCFLVCWLLDWSVGWLVGWLVGPLVGRLVGCVVLLFGFFGLVLFFAWLIVLSYFSVWVMFGLVLLVCSFEKGIWDLRQQRRINAHTDKHSGGAVLAPPRFAMCSRLPLDVAKVPTGLKFPLQSRGPDSGPRWESGAS